MPSRQLLHKSLKVGQIGKIRDTWESFTANHGVDFLLRTDLAVWVVCERDEQAMAGADGLGKEIRKGSK
jgi:hypothetical protein